MNTDILSDFLGDTDFSKADIRPLAGDASARRYDRLFHPNGTTAVLMVAPPKSGEDMGAFIDVADFLRSRGLSAPEIYKVDHNLGLMLLEDFGDNLFFNVAETNPKSEYQIYSKALSVLPSLDAPVPDFPATKYCATEMTNTVADVIPWYAPHLEMEGLSGPLKSALEQLDWSQPRLALRDYHAQNLIWMPERDSLKSVGLLDFQSAQISHPLYDAASLLIDARRDVSADVLSKLLIDLETSHKTDDDFQTAFWTVSAQRNLRIIGVFARLNARDKKPNYIDLIPRVWANLENDVAKSGNTTLQRSISALPKPTPEYLDVLRGQA